MTEDYKQYANELYKPAIKNFARRKVYTSLPDEIWGADLIDMSKLKTQNKNVTFALVIVDIYSRYCWVFPLKDKSGYSILTCFQSMKSTPNLLWVDEGKEFYNKDFKAFCDDNKIKMYHTFSGMKSSFVERLNRTLKEKIYKYLTENQTDKYLQVLDEIVDNYNNKVHSVTKQKPIDIYLHNKKPFVEIEEKTTFSKPKYKIGDYVRISKTKKTFEKGYTTKWSKEVFQIESINFDQEPIMYHVKDLEGEEITGGFYEEELQISAQKDFRNFLEVVQTKTENKIKYYLVKYEGYGSKFNEWKTEKELKELKAK